MDKLLVWKTKKHLVMKKTIIFNTCLSLTIVMLSPFGWHLFPINLVISFPAAFVCGYKLKDFLRYISGSINSAAGTLLATKIPGAWTHYSYNSSYTYPPKPARYEVYEAGSKQQYYEIWNGSGWDYNGNDITHYRKLVPPVTE